MRHKKIYVFHKIRRYKNWYKIIPHRRRTIFNAPNSYVTQLHNDVVTARLVRVLVCLSVCEHVRVYVCLHVCLFVRLYHTVTDTH